MKKLILVVLAVFLVIRANAQVSLAPTAVFLDKNGMGTLYVTNSSSTPQEITISFQFGYPTQDEKGNLIMKYDDTINAQKHGLDKIIKAFPRTFILPPNQQQLVRFQARPPKDMPDGAYFTRIRVSSTAQSADIGVGSSDGVNTRVNVRFEQVIAGFFKKGNATTGLNVSKIEGFVDSNFVSVKAHFATTGNAPYLGRLKMSVKDGAGKIVAEGTQTMALYFSGTRTMNLRSEGQMRPGRYTVELFYETDRSDIPIENLIQAQPYTYKGYINVD